MRSWFVPPLVIPVLEALPIGVVAFPGSGIAANLADKAKKLGIPVWRFDKPADPGDGV